MSAMKAPAGAAVTPDAKTSVESSSTETTPEPEVTEEALPEDSLDEADLESLDGQAVPYQRFRDVNEKAKSLQKESDKMKSGFEDELRRITTQY